MQHLNFEIFANYLDNPSLENAVGLVVNSLRLNFEDQVFKNLNFEAVGDVHKTSIPSNQGIETIINIDQAALKEQVKTLFIQLISNICPRIKIIDVKFGIMVVEVTFKLN